MNHKVKELFNSLYLDEEKEYKTNPNSKIAKRNKGFFYDGNRYPYGTRIGCHRYDTIKFDDDTYFFIFKNEDISYPIIWDSLEIDFSSQDKRYYKQYDKHIYKVSNEYMYQKCIDEDLDMAISIHTLEKIKKDIKNSEYINISNIILISKLFFEYENIHMGDYDFYKEFKVNNFTRELGFKTIILDVLNTNDIKQTIEYYNQNGVDLEKIIFQILPSFNDDKFKIQVEEKIKKLIKKEDI